MVSGVRRSWETARSKFARIFSFSASARTFSCCFSFVVSALVINTTTNIITAETRFSVMIKLNFKYGKVKAKFTTNILIIDATSPYMYPSVYNEIMNTANVKIAATNEFTPRMFVIPASIPINRHKMITVNPASCNTPCFFLIQFPPNI